MFEYANLIAYAHSMTKEKSLTPTHIKKLLKGQINIVFHTSYEGRDDFSSQEQ